ncbi:bifunctional hydroxymethylpyrimidine kinase/phosphomethylpyrimidine kinase [Allosphingosinicella indica]|uniref:hydroxymethylpyrimidine kinase n=1 Tax=Allosphingosinicella indica TaxID=941907 RepID=A0A1X7FZK4_9SPHN|nr:bifunctional hydroxymethylpyrimidine kinase/phosphomethylpyrimidine kinase [Allosphingosinicella indica]SMF61548.1 hydroxymethylpyrimidine/phosphomethylpyrimidine kinase [Allosphingosinicella indica]
MTPRVLIIAGSDSGGGAGIQADIKTVTVMHGHAMTAVTAITAQNTLGVTAVHPIPADMVVAQIAAVQDDIGIDAVKIGMIGSPETAEAVAEALERLDAPIVFDPVMVASSGAVLADAPTVAAFRRLMDIAAVVTPNAAELAALTGASVTNAREAEAAARNLADAHSVHVLAKGGHIGGDEAIDILVSPEGDATQWSAPRIVTRHDHGTGCTLASAIATGLGRGAVLPDAIAAARDLVRSAMAAAPGFGAGHGPMGHWAAASGLVNLNQVTVPTGDYAASVAFYRTLGLTQIVNSPPLYARFECPGGATLSIHLEEEPVAGDAVIYFEASDLDAWVERLRAAGLAFDALPEDKRWRWREAHLRDPAGNRICLYRAAEIRRFPPWRMTAGEGSH